MFELEYLMENDEEALRLDWKTDTEMVGKQALWAGIEPGMRVADVCCGPGKTTRALRELVGPGGAVTGIDGSLVRLEHAKQHYGGQGIDFIGADIREPLNYLGSFDFVWVRFVLEYHRAQSFDIARNISEIVKPGGILCLIDLDHNCLSHYGLSERLERTLFGFFKTLEERGNFDPYAGRRQYTYLYRLGYKDIKVDVAAHHLIYGELKDNDAFNWLKKIEVASQSIGYGFEEYEGGYEEFLDEFNRFFSDPGRLTYTPAISVSGRKPFA
jgi:ubiquinone/menaquinone biosynthesis C-methylase UbiE